MDSEIPHDVTMTAEVNVPAPVTLYDAQGNEIVVNERTADYFIMTYGFSRARIDPQAAHAELDSLFDAARDAVRRMVAGVTETGQIDPHPDAAYAAARVAMDDLTGAWGTLHQSLHARYGMIEQGQPRTLRAADGSGEILVDPGQVDLYGAQGYVQSEGV